jgi:hypothetical protein
MGRVYVHLGKATDAIDFSAWCRGIAQGRSYISDGYAHALEFTVDGVAPGYGEVKLKAPGSVQVKAKVAFAKEVALGTAPGAEVPKGDMRNVELIVNGKVVKSKEIPADDKEHELHWTITLDKSSWVAIRHFPQLHTNPVNVLVADQPIRASKASAQWCIGVIEQLWRVRAKDIKPEERGEAEKAFHKALDIYKQIAAECREE